MDSFLKKGNECFQKKKYAQSINFYEKSLGKYAELDDLLKTNISLSKKRLALNFKLEDLKNVYLNYIVRLGNDLGEESAKQYYPTEGVGRVNESDPLVSIIMPTWNRGYVIGEAIASVLDQTYSNWELLVCDDASSDNTQEVIESFNDQRISYSKLKKTNGAVARNHGLRAAAGDIYAFLDSDNIWSPNYLEEIVKAHSNADTAIVYTAFLDTQVSNDKFISVDKKYKEFSYLDIAHRNYIDLNTVSLKPFVYLELGGFDPDLPRQQDWDLLVRYTAHYKPLGIDKPLVLYRRNADWGQVTTTKKHIDTRKVILNKNKELAEKYKVGKLPKDIAIENLSKKIGKKPSTIAIKISAPNEEVAFEWGDYHFAHQLGKALYKFGWEYAVHCQDVWYTEEFDVNIVLRGRHRFNPDKTDARINYLWIISHPDRLVSEEIADYNHVFVASETFVHKVRKASKTPATVLHQATDPEIFKPNDNVEEKLNLPEPIIFIGNSRNEYRTMVKWCLEENISLALWGSRWEQFVNPEIIRGQYIPNNEVAQYYSSCDILLNDHWETMRKNGFISNRIFDASAAGAFIITDGVTGLDNVFKGAVISVNNRSEFSLAVEKFIKDPVYRKKASDAARKIVVNNHTFLIRAEEIDKYIRAESFFS